ncbi:redoxin domain-containing protein [Anoxynatronum buryatiense]|uniref:redoxin domain-containing protein n=1 Tax=Anoxynatronum buryatiense TaxID=489973 RepID=UPI003211CD24
MCTQQLGQLNEVIEEIEDLGYALYGVSADTPAAHEALTEKIGLSYPLMSDPEIMFYREAGIIQPQASTVHRGVVIYSPEGERLYQQVTDDPATVLLQHLQLNR